MITFLHSIPFEDTLIFEKVYEEDLQSDLVDKSSLLAKGDTTWLFVNGVLAGEAQAIGIKKLLKEEEDEIKDIDDSRYLSCKSAYLYSFTILPEYQGKGYGKILLAYHLGWLTSKGYDFLTIHCTEEAMENLAAKFNGVFLQGGVHKNWYGTSRTVRFCEVRLSPWTQFQQTDDWSCGPYALQYLLFCNNMLVQNMDFLRKELKTNTYVGTDCDDIIIFLTRQNISFTAGKFKNLAKLPMLVRYLEDGDEHYGVVTKNSLHNVFIFNPWTGKIEEKDKAHFYTNWNSKRFGKYWGLSLCR